MIKISKEQLHKFLADGNFWDMNYPKYSPVRCLIVAGEVIQIDLELGANGECVVKDLRPDLDSNLVRIPPYSGAYSLYSLYRTWAGPRETLTVSVRVEQIEEVKEALLAMGCALVE